MTCKDCIHFDICVFHLKNDDANQCAHYKDKTKFIELPVKAGQTVYMPWEWDGQKGVAIPTVTRIVFDITNEPFVLTDLESDCEEYLLAYNCGRFAFDDFGKTVFLTREEAERALKGAEE